MPARDAHLRQARDNRAYADWLNGVRPEDATAVIFQPQMRNQFLAAEVAEGVFQRHLLNRQSVLGVGREVFVDPTADILASYEKVTGSRFPPALLRPAAVERIDKLLVASLVAAAAPLLTGFPDLANVDLLPADYYLVGFWGHGVNSYAFYYQLVEPGRIVLFRIPYGGVYMDNKKAAEDMRQFFDAFAGFLELLGPNVIDLVATDSMWEGKYRIRLTTGASVEHTGSFLGKPDFVNLFGAALE